MVRFDPLADGPGKLGLSELITALLDFSGSSAIGFVVLAESACIVGASLLKSPTLGPLVHSVPAVRDWLTFTTERVSEKSLALLVGVAGRNVPDACCAVSSSPSAGRDDFRTRTRGGLQLPSCSKR